jgi:hypothetical protein
MSEKTRADDPELLQQVADRAERDSRFHDFDRRLADMKIALDLNTKVTQDIADVMSAAKVGLKFIGVIGIVVKWVGVIAGAAVAIYTAIYTFTHGGKP